MRNLKLIQILQPSGSILSAAAKLSVFCLGEYGCVYVCGDGVLSKVSLDDNNEPSVLCEGHDALRDVAQMQFVSSTGMTYLVNNRGSFLQFLSHSNEVEELFQSDQGIAYFSVSPDSRFVVIITRQNTMLLLTLPDLETLSQQDLSDGGTTVSNACWEPDFVKVAWKEDSHFFVVNSKRGENFQIKIFDETGTLHSKTEDTYPLLSCLVEWQPSGGLIAAVGTTPHGTVVSFFERNGLKRADFYPYEGKNETYESDKVIDVSWNSSSDILSVRYNEKVELWVRNNYVWMRKLTLRGPENCNSQSLQKSKLAFTHWDRDRLNRLHIINESGAYVVYDVAFTFTTGYSNGSAIVASKNGTTVYCTPFRDSCCPPPNCLFQGSNTTDTKAVLIPEFWDGILTLSNLGEFTFWQNVDSKLKQIRTIGVPAFEDLAESYDWLWPNRNNVVCVSKNTLAIFELQNSDSTNVDKITIISPKLLTVNNIVSAFPVKRNKEESMVLVQIRDGTILRLDLTSSNSIKLCRFPHICTDVQILAETIVVGFDSLTRKLMIGWTEHSENEVLLVSNDCTSFVVFQNSLIFTTIQGSVEVRNQNYLTKLLHKHVFGSEFNSDEDSQERYTRKCEKGSVIVSCCLNQMLEPSLVLQIIPRGNLEIIYPRPLLIKTVKVVMREKENNSRYEKIMTALRRHRIDYKILMDEMKVMVREDADCRLDELLKTMVEQVKNSHSLVLLITDLNQDYSDCIMTLKNILQGVIETNKAERMLHVEESYLASMAKLGLLEEALKSHLVLGESDTQRELVQHRVKFLSFYCENPDILFDTALGTYDLNLASLVADCLGKDPKEYLPILDNFQSMLELKRRFKIDDKLRRYNKAVINLVRDQRVQHDEIVKYMERHRLFTDAIEFLTRKLNFDEGGVVERSREDTNLLLRETQSSYAYYLEERGKFTEASIMFREASNIKMAVESSIKSGNWEFALEIEYENGGEEETIRAIGKEILLQLEERKMYSDAARLSETYLGDIEQAVYFWIKDKKWQPASTLSLKSHALGKAFRDETIKPKLLESCHEQKETMQQTLEDIESKINRLRKIKQLKAERIAESGGIGDNFSDTESYLSGSSTSGSISSSNMSGKSFRSAKNKRKLDRKVYSLKEGSKYEDLAIIAHLWTKLERIQLEIKPEVSYSIESLWKFNSTSSATELCDVLEQLLHVGDECIQEVWSAPIADEILEMKFRIPPVTWTLAWNKLALHQQSSKASIR